MYRLTRWFRRWIGLRSWFIARHHQEIYFETDQIGSPERKVLAEREGQRWGRKRTGKGLSNKRMSKALSRSRLMHLGLLG